MPLGSQDVEATKLAHDVTLFVALFLEVTDHLVERVTVLIRVHARRQEFVSGQPFGVAAEQDVHAASGHVRCDRDRTDPTGLGHDRGLGLVLLGVEDGVRDAALLEQVRQVLRPVNRDRADQDRLAAIVPSLDVVRECVELRVLGLVDEVGFVVAHHGAVRRDADDFESVGMGELAGLGVRSTGHAGELVVELEVVLERDGREGLVLLFDPHTFLRFHRLVEAVTPAPAVQDATRELIDDPDLAFGDDIVDVAFEEFPRLQSRLELVHEVLVDVLVEVVHAERVFDAVDPFFGGDHGALGFIDLIVTVALEHLHHSGELEVERLRVIGPTRDDERSPSLVDQDRVHLVHDGEEMTALRLLFARTGHVVAEVVEPELVVRSVGDVRRVRLALFFGIIDVRQDGSDFESEEPVDPPHPCRVAFGEVIVGRDEVNTLAGERVEVCRQRRGERLALPRFHLGDPAEVQRRAAHHLDVEVTLTKDPLPSLADGRERLREEVVEVLTLLQATPVDASERLEFRVRPDLHLALERRHLGRDRLEELDLATFARVQQLRKKTHQGQVYR